MGTGAAEGGPPTKPGLLVSLGHRATWLRWVPQTSQEPWMLVGHRVYYCAFSYQIHGTNSQQGSSHPVTHRACSVQTAGLYPCFACRRRSGVATARPWRRCGRQCVGQALAACPRGARCASCAPRLCGRACLQAWLHVCARGPAHPSVMLGTSWQHGVLALFACECAFTVPRRTRAFLECVR